MRIGLFGLPGAGKGTQALRLADDLKIPHISTGDMFRELEKGETELAREIKAILASGKLVSDDKVTRLVFDRLEKPDCKNGFILDGYPRTLAQVIDLQNSAFKLDALISLEVDKDEIIRRLSDRRVCPQCKSTFSLSRMPAAKEPICPQDGSLLLQRPDDTVVAVKTRLGVFEGNFSPVISFFRTKGLLYHVNGNGSLDEVFGRLRALIADIFNKA